MVRCFLVVVIFLPSCETPVEIGFYTRKIWDKHDDIFSSPEPKAHGELIVYQSNWRLCVCVYVCVSTLSNINISETCGPIANKFYLKHHWGDGKAALGFRPDRIGTLVPMATDSSHRVIMRKMLSAL